MISKTIRIWDDVDQPLDSRHFFPTLITYILDGGKKRSAVLICPGGGYGSCSEREAEPIAIQFNAAGFHAFVLYYSVSPEKHPQPLLDVSRSMCILRKNADAWNIYTDQIAVCGFSAGAHLAASLGVHWAKPYIMNVPGIEKGMNYPNALILCYPVITSGQFSHQESFKNLLGADAGKELLHELSLEHQINEKTPPVFIWHTYNDKSVPVENSLLFAQGLRNMDVPFELHIYHDGPHGLSLATEETMEKDIGVNPHAATWFSLCTEWLGELFSPCTPK